MRSSSPAGSARMKAATSRCSYSCCSGGMREPGSLPVRNGCSPVAGGAGRPQQAGQQLVEDGGWRRGPRRGDLKADPAQLAAAQAGGAAAGALAGLGDGGLDAGMGLGAQEFWAGVVAGELTLTPARRATSSMVRLPGLLASRIASVPPCSVALLRCLRMSMSARL
jgi:hypothetical protein